MGKFWTGAALLVMVACGNVENTVEQTSRDLAKGVVNGVIQQKFPGVNAAPYTDCIIDNASLDEIVQLAQGAVTGGAGATTLVLEIAGRPATTQCITQNALGVVLG